jgi:hypothetical protein
MMQNARSNLTEIFRTRPLALGAVGLAIGAGIAAALPPTEVETDYLGETSDAFKERAQALVAEQATRTAAAAESAISAAAEEARNQGLTVEDAGFAASEISEKMGRVLSAAGKKASEGARGPSGFWVLDSQQRCKTDHVARKMPRERVAFP